MKIFYRLIFLFSMILSSGGSLVYAQENNDKRSFFNPENTWEYLFVEKPWIFDDIPDWVNVWPVFFSSPDVVTREGREYRRFIWNWKDEDRYFPRIESYFLLREDNGAYYIYIDPSEEERPEDDESDYHGIRHGEYLLYDFNMEVGSEYSAPVATYLNQDTGGALLPECCWMTDFMVVGKDIERDGRRSMILQPKANNNFTISLIEGVGPLYNDFNLAAFYDHAQNTGMHPEPFYTLYNIKDSDGQEIYINPDQESAGFLDERDYTWIYGVFDSEGNVSYNRMKFNYLMNHGGKVFRRFMICSMSDNPVDGWDHIDYVMYLVREENGQISLLHDEDYMVIGKGSNEKASLIYNFGAEDGSELTFYSPEGEQIRRITTEFTEVGGEPRRSYTFNGSDGVTCVEGIGIIKGGILPVVNGEFRLPGEGEEDTYVGAALVAVCDGDGNLIFRQDMPSIVEEIPASADGYTAPSDRIYDLQGCELRSPIPGQPYIQGGKIHSGRKHE